MKHKYRKYLQKYFDFVIEISQNAICYHEKKTTNPIHKPLRHPVCLSVSQLVEQWVSQSVSQTVLFGIINRSHLLVSKSATHAYFFCSSKVFSYYTPYTQTSHEKKRNTMVVHSLALLRTTLFAKPQ